MEEYISMQGFFPQHHVYYFKLIPILFLVTVQFGITF